MRRKTTPLYQEMNKILEQTLHKRRYVHNHKAHKILVIRQMQIKTTEIFHYTRTRRNKVKKMRVLSVDKDMEQLKVSYAAVGNVK